jgi:hypothetical protein
MRSLLRREHKLAVKNIEESVLVIVCNKGVLTFERN